MADPVCECGHELHRGRCGYWECKPKHEDCYNCPCEEFTDARIAGLLVEVARLTPQATRELPTREGWYQRFNRIKWEFSVVKVFEREGELFTQMDDGPHSMPLKYAKGYFWSREPIAPMTIPDTAVEGTQGDWERKLWLQERGESEASK